MELVNLCTSVFKKGSVSEEEYTAVWITLINSFIRDQRVLAPKEKRT